MELPLQNRQAAGRALADQLTDYQDRDDVLVLALPRGGVPVAEPVAQALNAPLDVMVVRKLGVPGHEELAMGAIASGGVRVLNDDVIRINHVDDRQLDSVAAEEGEELTRREQKFRGDREYPSLSDRCVIVIDDGVATGSTMRASLRAIARRSPREVVVAVPVAPEDTLIELQQQADRVVCLATPSPFNAIGAWYREFGQTSSDEVREILERNWAKGK